MLGSGDGGSHIIRLRGLPFSTTVEDVLDFLSGINVLNEKEGVHLTEVRPGRPSGECFVELVSQADVDEALKKDKENMGKRYIEVFSTDRQDMEWALNAMNHSENGFGGIPNLNDDMGIVKLRGLPFGCSKEEIIQFFDGLMVAPDGVHLLYDYTGRASGEAFVHFVDKGNAQEALNRDREKIGHRYIEVFPSSADEVRAYGARDAGRGSSRPRPTPYDRGDRYGQRFTRGRGFVRGGGGGAGRGGFRRGGYCVHMRGLPFKATPQDIAYFFKPVRPVSINILYDNSGRPSGEADVDFECHDDAMRAMRRDKHNMDHRYIELFLNSAGGGSGSAVGGAGGGAGFKPARTYRNLY
ncbi:PREDICTED: heterogeneous nuclear ribonucleoprotein F [Papilio xuthus]|uniref:Heterogeneous nuclear ribonucleoprotein F n=1 Tax=Papilio xuthus TaxID=66420 RepID=A0AAJ7E968_PAPXU|nr:PREDICTED: heterogeneous nuclear ribonucleoprotein F [Papilio xuthus]